jgi:hypothetical protein
MPRRTGESAEDYQNRLVLEAEQYVGSSLTPIYSSGGTTTDGSGNIYSFAPSQSFAPQHPTLENRMNINWSDFGDVGSYTIENINESFNKLNKSNIKANEMTSTQYNFEDIVEKVQYPKDAVLPIPMLRNMDVFLKYTHFGKPLPISRSETQALFADFKHFKPTFHFSEDNPATIYEVYLLHDGQILDAPIIKRTGQSSSVYYKSRSLKTKAVLYKLLTIVEPDRHNDIDWINESVNPYVDCEFSVDLRRVFGEKICQMFDRYGIRNYQRKVCFNSPHDVRFNPENLTMSYISKGRETTMKPGRLLVKFGKLYDIDFQDNNNVKKLQMELTISQDDRYKFKIVEGQDILKYYKGTHYNKNINTNSLGKSCMRSENCTSWLAMYLSIPNIKMLILHDDIEDKIIGRALLFETTDGTLVMDRIYGTEKTFLRYTKWAIKNGYWRKLRQTHDNQVDWVNPNNGQREAKKWYLKCDVTKFKRWPYVDSFMYALNDRTLTNRILDADAGKYIGSLRDIHGGMEDKRF